MPSAPVILHAGLNDQQQHVRHKYDIIKKKTEVKHNDNDPLVSLDYAHVRRSIIYITTRSAKRTQQVIPQQAPKTQQVGFTHPRTQQLYRPVPQHLCFFRFLC